MESAACRRRASDAEQSARWTYSATAECEPVTVKEEPEGGECGVSEAAVAGLYAGHEVKDEVVIGPETVQQQDVAFSMQSAVDKTEVDPCQLQPAGGAGAAPECTHTRPGEGPRCNMSHDQQFQLRSCSVRPERMPMEDLFTCNLCLVIFH
ncbi:hypothetical protein MSG28_014832 [Choristoneura fumiferana]|uniref:Uncharacterized protein n=1 Tax=Choristoneura fumiferana TaxID=7141 RepID=A0ACC0JSU4_CHOFU|nr:hypothetical protein MSG28_014832 [Choristoneura fumiferana]